jgi:sugar phosphate isomerase/epimerase
VFGLPPADFVQLAADLGCQHISLAMQPMDYNPQGYPVWSLRDKTVQKDLKAAMARTGVTVSLADGFCVFPDRDVRAHGPDLEIIADLGVPTLNTLSFDPDMARSIEQFGVLADMAREAGVTPVVEFTPSKKIASLADALEVRRQTGRGNLKVLVDTMHMTRSGSWPRDAQLIDPETVGYIQLCDAPLKQRYENYTEEGMYERMVPGTGELPLREIMAALPRDKVVGLEVPQRSLANEGIGPRERLQPCVEAARKLLASLEAEPA